MQTTKTTAHEFSGLYYDKMYLKHAAHVLPLDRVELYEFDLYVFDMFYFKKMSFADVADLARRYQNNIVRFDDDENVMEWQGVTHWCDNDFDTIALQVMP